LSLSTSAQYGEPASGVHLVCDEAHEPTHAPFEHIAPAGHALPHAPQFRLSVLVFAQNEAPPPSGWHSVALDAHDEEHVPFTHACPDAHATPHLPQFALSFFTSTQ